MLTLLRVLGDLLLIGGAGLDGQLQVIATRAL
jgi:hypothetical protein